ncbi:hypothetical protein L1285_23265 [Pseudoalteromonas sp. DL2-H2.2]|nr:hypothetical protein [Pseudoalteromonas sp. DL2-H2.2]MCF2911222.1 hypothetical protein [Pseudoalteromonas sp. DL2-H2.2]
MKFKVNKKELKSLSGKNVLNTGHTKEVAGGKSLQYSLITKTTVAPVTD